MTTFPSTPTVGDLYEYGGSRYKWDGSKWVIQTATAAQNLVTALNGNIDLSKGTYHKLSTNEGKVVQFQNVPAGSSKWSLELDINSTSKYDIVTAAGKTHEASVALADGSPFQVSFKPDGTQFFVVGTSGDKVYQYTMTTPWDISTATAGSTFDVASYDANMVGLTFHPDGLYMYLGGSSSKTIYQFELTTPWDITTAGAPVHTITGTDYDRGYSLSFSAAGDKFYFLGQLTSTASTKYILQYNLSTPWDISSSSYVSSPYVGDQDTEARSYAWSNDGRKLYVAGYTNDRVYRYSLSTPWTLSTATYDSVYYTILNETTVTSINFNNDGSKMYISGTGSDTLRQYSTSFNSVSYSGAFTWPAEVVWDNTMAPTISANETTVLDFMSVDGGSTINGKKRVSTSAIPKLGLVELVSYTGTSYSNSTWYNSGSIDVSDYVGRQVRLVFKILSITTTTNTNAALDLVTFNGTTYSFENTTESWQTSGASETQYAAVSWITPTITTGTIMSQWAVSTGVTRPTGGGSYALYSLPLASLTGTAWARSPLVTLTDPTMSFYWYKTTQASILYAYIELVS